MPTAPSSTDPTGARGLVDRLWRPVVDTGHLVRFRAHAVRRPRAVRVGWGVLVLITVAVAVLPALWPGAGSTSRASGTLILVPTFMAGFAVLAAVSAVASGGGRELLPHDQAVAFPVSPTTDHLGALLMAPLNIAWLLQAWFLLGAAAFGRGTHHLVWVQVVLVLWLAVATAAAQLVAWTMEAIRRTRHGQHIFRAVVAVTGLGSVWLQLSGNLGPFLDALPTAWFLLAAVGGFNLHWVGAVLLELVLIAAAVLAGAWPAGQAARRLPRDEQKVESSTHQARPTPASAFAMLTRIDRASVWRTVPMRRGLAVLAIGPGLVALAGALPWDTVMILPGLVVSGGVLLFGVNAWSLDGRGALWRESLPADPGLVFRVRSWVMAEWLLAAALVTVVLSSLRAGVPTAAQAAAVVSIVVVIVVQVVAVAMSWSAKRPFAVNLRSARATPAPPIVMVGYSARLATSTTLTSMVFSTMARGVGWEVILLLTAPFLVWSILRWRRAARRWDRAPERALVVTAVAA